MPKTKTALITGITGQDGSYLAEFLLKKGYTVHGIVRRSTSNDESLMSNLALVRDKITLHVGSLDNPLSLHQIVDHIKPDECYHLAAPSFVSHSLDDELATFTGSFSSTHSLLAALRECSPRCRFYFAGSSEMFGRTSVCPQDESVPLNPRSIYGIAKVAGYHLAKNYRDNYGIFTCTGFLFNHESPRRRMEFVTRKVSSTVARIKLGLEKKLVMGTLDAERDWGYAPEYVEAMWLMMQQEHCDDYVIATNKSHSVRYFVESAFRHVGLNYQDYVQYDERYLRAPEKVALRGNPAKAARVLNWRATKPLDAIIAEMVDSDLALYRR
jgi:GDPmannose 4,6-dehydratase